MEEAITFFPPSRTIFRRQKNTNVFLFCDTGIRNKEKRFLGAHAHGGGDKAEEKLRHKSQNAPGGRRRKEEKGRKKGGGRERKKPEILRSKNGETNKKKGGKKEDDRAPFFLPPSYRYRGLGKLQS